MTWVEVMSVQNRMLVDSEWPDDDCDDFDEEEEFEDDDID